MKQLIRRLSRVADSSQYKQLSKEEGDFPPEGHIWVYVGDEMERFEVPAAILGRPAFTALLHASATEYGYEQRGGLRIPCSVALFRRVLNALMNPAAATAADRSTVDELVRSLASYPPDYS